MRLIYDIETNNYLQLFTKIHCIVAKDFDTGILYKFRPHQIDEAVEFLSSADLLIGHNIIDFDNRAIQKMYPNFKAKNVYDTLIAAKLAFPDIKEKDFIRYRSIISKPNTMRTELERAKMRNIGKHSLEAYGIRLGEYKGDYGKENGFEEYTEEMLDYCVQDVEVNAKLYEKLLSMELNEGALTTEFTAQEICLQQTVYGFTFDYTKAEELLAALLLRQKELLDEIESDLGGPFIHAIEVVTPKRNTTYKEVLRGSYKAGCPYSKIKITEFNAGSRTHLATRLIERHKWIPKAYGDDGKPTVSEEVLEGIDIPVAKSISEYLMIQKRLGMLSEGKQSWLGLYNPETKAIHGKVNTLGAGTSRATHSNPNLAQLPSVRVPYGKECRQLFTVPKGWKLFGTDAAGLELRMLAHYMFPFDKGVYGDVILNGDIHTVNQEAAGLPTRNDAKTFIYALL